jgi:hypothetical protein
MLISSVRSGTSNGLELRKADGAETVMSHARDNILEAPSLAHPRVCLLAPINTADVHCKVVFYKRQYLAYSCPVVQYADKRMSGLPLKLRLGWAWKTNGRVKRQ